MATVNLGRIKPVFKGTWSNSTAYTVDDFVVHSNECYIAIQAGTNQNPASASSYWTKIAAKGSDGTDVGAALSNNQIAYKNNSGTVTGLSIGSAGQFLKVNSSANGYEYGAVSSDFVKLHEVTMNGSDTGITFDNYFSSDYKHFKIIADKIAPDTNTYDGYYIRLLDASGSERTTSNYRAATVYHYYNSSTSNWSTNREWDTNHFRLHVDHIGAYEDRYKPFWLEFDILDPLKADTRTRVYWRNNSDDGSGDSSYLGLGDGYLDVPEANRGFKFYSRDGDAIDSRCTIKLYGIK